MFKYSGEQGLYQKVGVKTEEVSDILGEGSQMLVRGLRHAEVLKAPLVLISSHITHQALGLFVGQKLSRAKKDLEVMKGYLGSRLVGTTLLEGDDDKSFTMTQERIDPRRITLEIFNHSQKIRDQVLEINRIGADMLENEGLWLDLMGFNVPQMAKMVLVPNKEPFFDNMFINGSTDKVVLVDVGVFENDLAHSLPFAMQQENARRFGFDFSAK